VITTTRAFVSADPLSYSGQLPVRQEGEAPLRQTDNHAASTAVVEHEPESEPDEHRARRSVERLGYGRSTQPAGKGTRGKGEQAEPENAFGRVNGSKQHAEQSHRDSGGNKLRQECNVENAHFRVEKVG